MATKNISIMEDVYRLLRAAKGETESFSDVLRRTLRQKAEIMELAGAWSEMSDEEANAIKTRIRELSNRSTRSLLKRFGRST